MGHVCVRHTHSAITLCITLTTIFYINDAGLCSVVRLLCLKCLMPRVFHIFFSAGSLYCPSVQWTAYELMGTTKVKSDESIFLKNHL